VFRDFKVGEHVLLKVKVKRSSLRLGSFPMLATIYCGPFEILENIGPVAYMLALHASMEVHIVIHVSLLSKYVHEPNHIIDWIVIQVEHKGYFRVELVRILGRKVKVFMNKSIGLVKVQWNCYGPKDATWEHEKNMREEYPQIFVNFEENKMQDSILSS
jgi:hypothetical protein